MNFGSITLKDIAKELGLSASAVSKALKDSHEISEKTKKLVLDYAREHNYRPNQMAQGLKKGISKSIGVVVSEIDNQFFSQVINGIESVAYNRGYNVIITQAHESYQLEVSNVNLLTYRSVDGLLISLSTETKSVDHLKQIHQQGLPIVFFDRVSSDINTHKVIADNFRGAYEATKHLIISGYRKIAHITSSANVSITTERLNGYLQCLKDHDLPVYEQYIKYCAHGGNDVAEIELVLDQLLSTDEKPDAIFTASDRISTVTLSLLHKLKIKIPAEIALLGFSNTQLAEVLNPSLTTIYQPGFDMGKKATEMLIGLIESKYPVTEFETVVFPTQLFLRDSSGAKHT